MDVVRTVPVRRQPRLVLIIGGVLLLILVTVGLARLRPAGPEVDKRNLVIDTVARGTMLREVRGGGVLVPENVRWITAALDARVERVIAQPGTVVKPDTIIIELTDAQQQQSSRDAEWQLREAEADYETVRAELDSRRLDLEASVARLRSEYQQARLRAEADRELQRQGLAAKITQQLSETTAEELARRLKIEEQRVQVARASQASQLASRRAAVEQRRAVVELRTRALQVRAGIEGVLQQINVQEGQSVTAGATLARVAQNDRLKAQVRIPETQAKDIAIGQRATIDTRNGTIAARVSRIDPAVTNGSVLVDLSIDGPLPAGARPDLNIDAVIELERLGEVANVTRPVNAQENSTVTMFRVSPDGRTATRVQVGVGRASATNIEIRNGLKPGDRVIVSDTSSFDTHDTIQLQ